MVGKKLIMFIMSVLLFSLMVGCTKKDDRIQIGITQFATHVALDSNRQGFIDGLASVGYDEKKVHFILSNAQGDVPTANMIASDLVTKNVSLIMAIATPSAQAVRNVTENKDIALLFSAVTDPVSAGLVPATNVTGTSDAAPIDEQFALIKLLFPEAKKIGFVYSLGEANSIIQLVSLDLINFEE